MCTGAGHLGDAVLRQHDHLRAVPLGRLQQRRAGRIHGARGLDGLRVVRAEALQVVVQVRQVHQRQRRLPGVHHVLAGPGNPLAADDVRPRPPELEQRERAEPLGQLVAQGVRLGVDVRQLAPVRGVLRPRRHREVGAGVHVVPPEQLGAGERRVPLPGRVPDLLARDQVVRLPPQRRPRPARGSTSRSPRSRARGAAGRW